MDAGQISVLVVEDEALVRMNIVTELEDNGFRVLEAANALDAIVILSKGPVVDVLFTDVDMLGGLHRDLRHREVAKEDLPAANQFFPKPYTSEKIVPDNPYSSRQK